MAINHIGDRKYLTLDDRIRIETLIEQGANFSRIAKELAKSSSTISKEIRRHRFLVPHYHDSSNRRRSECVFYEDCNVQGLCGNNACSFLCSRCRSRRCTLYCSSFQGRLCDRLLKPPYVCNASMINFILHFTTPFTTLFPQKNTPFDTPRQKDRTRRNLVK